VAPKTAADIAELEQALEACCADLADALARAEALVAEQAAAAGQPLTDADGEALPRWRPLVLASIPGLDQLVSIIKPPLQVIVVLLQIIAALLQALAAILIGLPDPFEALILAAYELLVAIINDLLNTGAYMYIDAPGIQPTQVTLAETGLIFDPGKQFKAGQALQPPPITPDGFARWATRFQASFDDPGDLKRPVITEGAPIQAVFIVMAAPSLDALRQALYLIGKLFNIDAFKNAFEKYKKGVPDPRRTRARTKSVKPDWQAKRLQDLFPPLKKLMILPEALLGLLRQVDALSGLIKNLANAMQQKAQVLLQLAQAVQGIIDLLDALKSSGMYALNVSTNAGIPALKQAFVEAVDRPPGGYIGGICFLASGPNMAKAAMLWDLLGLSTAMDVAEGKMTLADAAAAARQGVLGHALDAVQQAGEAAKQAGEQALSAVEKSAQDFQNAVNNFGPSLAQAIGRLPQELDDMARRNREALVEALDKAQGFVPNDKNIQDGIAATRAARRPGARSLALAVETSPDDFKRTDTPTAGPPPPPAPGKGTP
jgi:hypothetical protein